MRRLRAWCIRLGGLFARERRERELDEEIESHLGIHIEENIQAGMTPAQARRDALIKLGGIDPIKESYRDRRGVPFLEHLIRDLRYGVAAALKNRGFTAVVVLTLALGIGVNALVFSVAHALFLRPLPYAEADRLAIIHQAGPSGGEEGLVSYSHLKRIQTHSAIFEAAAGCAYAAWPGVLKSGEDIELTSMVDVTEDFFGVLGVRPVLGGVFAPGDRSVILSHRLWRGFFRAQQDIVGHQVQLNGSTYSVAGVMPAEFQLFRSERPEIFSPSVAAARHPDSETLEGIVRLRRGVTLPQARQELARMAEPPAAGGGAASGYRVVDLRSHLFGSYRGALLTLSGAVLFVLLIACANAANLLLSRMTVRTQELRIRVALGASRARVASQLLMENLVTALLGGGAGLIIVLWGVRLLDKLRIAGYRSLPPFRIDAPVLEFVAISCLLVPVLCALVPVLRFSALAGGSDLKRAAPNVTPTNWKAASVMAVLGMAFSFMLLVGAGLLTASFLRLARVDPGFDASGALFVDFDDNRLFYTDLPRRQAFYDELVNRLQATPGVTAAGLTDQVPLSDDVWNVGLSATLVDPPSSSAQKVSLLLRSVDGGFFRALRIPLKSGRLLDGSDGRAGAPVALVNEGFARRVWGQAEPVGRRLKLLGLELTIVGVVGDVRELGLRNKPADQILYVPAGQFAKGNRVLVVRTAADPLATVSAVKRIARTVEPGAPAIRVRSMRQIVSDSISAERFSALLMSCLGGLALILACGGVYALVSFSVSQRTREFGVRVAMGAQQKQIVALLLRQGMALIGGAMAVGAVGGWILARRLAGQLYEVSPSDPRFFIAAGLPLAAFALLAGYLPARRASRADPVLALRQE